MICEYTNIHNENPLLTKDGLSFKIKKKHIHLYFIATQYLCKYALVEDIDNSGIYPYDHILKSSKIIFNRLVHAGNLKVRKPRLCFFPVKTKHCICMLIPNSL